MADMMFPEHRLDVPPLRLVIQYRQSAEDGGPVVRVFGPVDEEEKQILRIDCFAENPHYHLDPRDRDRVVLLSAKGHAAAIRWTLQQYQTKLDDLIREAGYPDLADRIDRDQLLDNAPGLEQMLHEVLEEGSRPF